MTLILDCSTTLAWVYPDETNEALQQLFDTIADGGCFVPMLWGLEVGNGLTVGMRRGRISPTFRTEALSVLELLPISVDAETVTRAWTSALQLADRFGLTLYDAAYLELAQRRSLPLATLDRALRTSATTLGIQLVDG